MNRAEFHWSGRTSRKEIPPMRGMPRSAARSSSKWKRAVRTLPPHQDSRGVPCYCGDARAPAPGLEGAN
eukprot:12818694-Alexandrium_andersonii.AAC.1